MIAVDECVGIDVVFGEVEYVSMDIPVLISNIKYPRSNSGIQIFKDKVGSVAQVQVLEFRYSKSSIIQAFEYSIL